MTRDAGIPRRIGLCAVLAVAAGVGAVSEPGMAPAAVSGPTAAAVSRPTDVVARITTGSVESTSTAATTQEFDSGNAAFSGTATTTGINLSAAGHSPGVGSTSFVVLPPPGQALHVGYYPRVASAAGQRLGGYASLDVSSCPETIFAGWMEIRALSVSGTTITKLDLLFEQHCGGGPAVSFGELRIGMPHTTGVIVSAGSITWPDIPALAPGNHAQSVTVTVRNSQAGPVTLGNMRLAGLAAGEFSLTNDPCSGATLAPGASCTPQLDFTAGPQGPRTAELVMPFGNQNYTVQLDSMVRPGTTSLIMHSQPGDPVGGGSNYAFTGANSVMQIGPIDAPWGVGAGPVPYAGSTWGLDVSPPFGDVLVSGATYKNATTSKAWQPHLTVQASPVPECKILTGSFTVKQAVFSPLDNSVQNFDMRFAQHCNHLKPALLGEFKWDAEPVTVAAPVSKLRTTVKSSGLDVTWANPASSAYRYTLVRIFGTKSPVGVEPFAGTAVYGGTGTSVVVPGLVGGQTYTVVAYAVDQYGNVSYPTERVVTF